MHFIGMIIKYETKSHNCECVQKEMTSIPNKMPTNYLHSWLSCSLSIDTKFSIVAPIVCFPYFLSFIFILFDAKKMCSKRHNDDFSIHVQFCVRAFVALLQGSIFSSP